MSVLIRPLLGFRRTLDAAWADELADELNSVLRQADTGRVVPLLAPARRPTDKGQL